MTARAVLEPLIWWAALYWIYLAIISTLSPAELLVGAAGAVVGAAAAVATQRVLLRDLILSPPRLRVLLLLPPQVLRDGAVLFRPVRGGFADVPVPPGRGGGVATLMLSVAPGTYVTQVSEDSEVLCLHRAENRPSRLEREVTSC
jgi:multisubunit Na+/H+ antiporter MnhE subunit